MKRFWHNILHGCLVSAACFAVAVIAGEASYGQVQKKTSGPICAVYVTGIGCSNCAVTDPALFVNATAASPDLIIFEYEIYHLRKENDDIQKEYFKYYSPPRLSPGVPFLVFNKNKSAIGKFNVLKFAEEIEEMPVNAFPKSDGTLVSFAELDLSKLPGLVKIWTKDRVLFSGRGGDSRVLKKILLEKNLSQALRNVKFETVDPEPVEISRDKIQFAHAVKIGDWRLQWNGAPLVLEKGKRTSMEGSMSLMVIALLVLGVALSFFRIRKTQKGTPLKFEFRGRVRDFIITLVSLTALIVFFLSARTITPDFLGQIGYDMPLPVFTFLIALVDGFNPCNMFVLTCLLALLISSSGSRVRLYIVALSFVGMVYMFYFMFMALWLNVFKYISFISPLRIAIGIIAVAAGIINCKELFFFKKGISLTIQDKHKGPLMERVQRMKEVIQKGSFPLLITSSLGLAALASLVELPCTAGFPIIYTGILSGKGLEDTISYYFYLGYYNLVYVLPLLVIIFIFVRTLRARQITQRQMEIIKFVGGIIMLLLGIVLLVNPGLLGLGIG